jgi:multidrug resistance efflux pump
MTNTKNNEQAAATSADDKTSPENTNAPADPVRRATLLTLAIIGLLLGWYLAADRFTPFSSQARVDAYVVPIAAQVTGNVVRVNVVNNQRVNAGDVLVELDDTRYVLAVNKGRADLEQAQQQFGASSASVDSAAASVKAAEAELVRAQKDFDRQRRIRAEDPGAISQRRLDLSESSLAAAKSRVSAARSELERAKQNRGRDAEENAGILAAQAALNQAELDLEWTKVRAPAGGLVTDLQLEIGNLAQPGKPLMTFVGINDVWIQADMRENNLGHIEPGNTVDVALDVQPGRLLKGKVRSIGFGVDAGTNAPLGSLPTIQNDRNWLREAQRFPVIIEIDSAGTEQLGLRVGAQATVLVYTDKSFVLVPLGKLYMRLVSLFSYLY